MKKLEKTKYLLSLATFYLKGEIYSENGFIKFKNPNTILGIIPLGVREESFLLKQLVSITSSFKLEIVFLIEGIVLTVVGLPTIVLSILGVLLVISSFQTVFEISTTGSAKKRISFIVFDNGKMYKVKDFIESEMAHNEH